MEHSNKAKERSATRLVAGWVSLLSILCHLRLNLCSGGVRGIVELCVLRQIERHVGYGIAIHELFDLVVGTSTGSSKSLLPSSVHISQVKVASWLWVYFTSVGRRTMPSTGSGH